MATASTAGPAEAAMSGCRRRCRRGRAM